jgi:PIN domain nuclease of toxin-antitoxin system
MKSTAEKTVPVTEFKAKCRDYIAQVSRGKVSRVVLTRRGNPPKDPVDRILIATARRHRWKLITRDRRILDYGARGFVSVLAC